MADDEKKKQVAKHILLDASGNEVEKEEQATGFGYTLIALQNSPFTFQTGMTPGERNTMLAVFGGKTLATNQSSAARNNAKGEASPQDQLAAVVDRFKLLETGIWVDRTREVGAQVDLDAMAHAILDVMIAAGKATEENKGDIWTTRRQRLEEDKDYLRSVKLNPDVAAAYAALKGKVAATVDDL